MPTSAYVIGVLVVFLTALFAVAYHFVPLYWAYQATEAYRRADAIRREVARLRADLRDAETPPAAVPAQALRADAWRDGLRAAAIQCLKSYPGVGDVTVQRLAGAGYLTLHDAEGRLTQPTFHVPGIGPSRVGEVCAAARAELRRQREDFDRGATPFAQRAEAEVRRRTTERDAVVARHGADATRIRQTLRDLEPRNSAAAKVTFWAYLRHRRATPDQPWPCDPALEVTFTRTAPAAPLPPLALAPALPVARRVEPVPAPEVPPRFPPSVEAITTLLYAVARADGRLAAAERAAVRRGLAKFFESDPVLVRHIDPALERLATANLDIDAALRSAVALSRRDRELLRKCAEDVNGAMATRHAVRDQMLERLDRALTLPGEAAPPPPVADPSELRSNELLDGMFGGPSPQAAPPFSVGEGLRENALLDDVFGGK